MIKEGLLALALVVGTAAFANAESTAPADTSAAHKKHKKHAHKHGSKKCKHKAEQHGDHTDYEHDGHHHHEHDGHYDECDGPEKS
jgi:hypothetical protein